jgi:hypothetical protein
VVQSFLIKLAGPAFLTFLIAIILHDSVGVPVEFLFAICMFVGWVLGRTVTDV